MLIDWVIAFVALLITVGIFPYSLAVLVIIALPVIASVMVARWGGTPGKLALGLRVVSTHGGPVGMGAAFLRETIGKFLSSVFIMLGYFSALWDHQNRAWHDHIAETLVIRIR